MFLLLGISGGFHQVAVAAASTAVGIGERLMTTRQLPTDPLGVVAAAATAAAFGEARTSSSDLLLPNSTSVSLDQCNSGSEVSKGKSAASDCLQHGHHQRAAFIDDKVSSPSTGVNILPIAFRKQRNILH